MLRIYPLSVHIYKLHYLYHLCTYILHYLYCTYMYIVHFLLYVCVESEETSEADDNS